MARRLVSLVGRNQRKGALSTRGGFRKVQLGPQNVKKKSTMLNGKGGQLTRVKVQLVGRVAARGKGKGLGKGKGRSMKGRFEEDGFMGGKGMQRKGTKGKGGKGKGGTPKGNSDGVWRHDLFHEMPAGRERALMEDPGPYSMSGIKGRGRRTNDDMLDTPVEPWETNGRKGSGNFKGKGGKGGGARGVSIENLEHSIMAEDLEELFGSVGRVQKAWVNYDDTDRSDGSGGCLFENAGEAKRAIDKFDGTIVEGMQIRIRMDGSKGSGKDGGSKGVSLNGRGRSRGRSRSRPRGRSRSRG